MPRAYAQDLRIRVGHAVDGGMSARGAARAFAVAASTAIKWVQLWRQSGSVAARPRGGGRKRVLDAHADWLLALAADEPDLTLEEIRRRLADRGVVVGHRLDLAVLRPPPPQLSKRPYAPPSRSART